jgi:hypothetical protein
LVEGLTRGTETIEGMREGVGDGVVTDFEKRKNLFIEDHMSSNVNFPEGM